MLRTLPTKEIKVFHSSCQVGLAYMVVDLFERKNRDFFYQVTLVVDVEVTSRFEAKWSFGRAWRDPGPMIATRKAPDIL
jgi:hypothetical protein